jgi:hypothetical protein
MLIVALASVSNGWAAEWFQLNPLDWEVIFEFDGRKRTGDAGDAKEVRFDEELRLRQSGYSLDPRIANFSLELNPVYSQGDFDLPDQDEKLDASSFNYDASVSLLHGTPGPVSFDAQATRNAGTSDFRLGSRSDFENKHQRLALNWKTSAFPSTFSYTERFLDETFRSGFTGAVSEREERLRTLSFMGHSSKTSVALEHNDLDDLVFDRDFTEERARLSHSARWGKGSHLNSRVEYVDREGFQGYKNFYLAENARLQHTKKLYSTYMIDHSSVTRELETERNAVSLGLTHQLYQNLTTSFALSGADTEFDSGDQDERGVRLDLNYNKKIIAWGAKLSASLGAGRRITDRMAPGGLLEIIDEQHVVDLTSIVVLNERFIDTTTIVVTDAAGIVVFTEGADYIIVPAANNVTQIQILPAGLINVGDTILVDYKFDSAPSVEFSTDNFSYRVALDFGWFSLFHRAFSSDQDLISGTAASFLTDRRDSRSGAQFRWSRPGITATFDIEIDSLRSGDFESDSTILRQSLRRTLSPKMGLTLSASETFTDSNGTDFDLYVADVSMRWRPRRRLTLTPRVGTWYRDEPDVSTQRFFTAGLDLQWTVRQLRITATLEHNNWGGTINDSDENRLLFTVTRRSR